MAGLFYNLGRAFGPKWRKGRWMWEAATGNEADLVAAEHAVGRDLHEAMVAELGAAGDSPLEENVSQIGNALAACVRDKRRQWRFTVVAGGEPNAFALPGGFVFITASLLDLVKRGDDEIAFILGHEMGHVIKQHPMHRIFSDAALGAAVRAVPAARGAAGGWIKSSALRLLQSAYSQDHELMADRFGARLAEAGGFDASAGPRMLARLRESAAARPEFPLAEYFATHPPLDLRIAELRGYIAARSA